MATISGSLNEKIFSVGKWMGLNEHPDGDTRLKFGEASKMVNWKITRDGNLKRRPGTELVTGLCNSYYAFVTPDYDTIGEFTEADEIEIYDSVSADIVPGKIVLTGNIDYVERGTLYVNDIDVEDGVASTESDSIIVRNGVMYLGGAAPITILELADALAELEEGAYLYLEHDERVYAINQDSLEENNGLYTLAGYPVVSLPDVESKQPIAGMWAGLAGGKKTLLVACDGYVYDVYNEETGKFNATRKVTCATDKGVFFIPFGGNVYILNGYDYYVYNGQAIQRVEGYVPLVAHVISPMLDGGGSESGELTGYYVNRLTCKRRVKLSPDGDTNKTFQLPEKFKTVDEVKYNGSTMSASGYEHTAGTDTITFKPGTTLTKGVDTIEVWYSVDEALSMRSQVTNNLYAELFSGNTDTGLFLYGDGTNRSIYTGMDENGMPRADYFPDQYEVHVGDSNTPITAMIRHYGVLMCYKTDSTWALNYGTTTLANGDATVAVYCTPVNRDKGNTAPGQVCLVNNSPVTCSGTELYQWTNSSYYTSQLTRDERQARRISDRVQKSIKQIDFEHCCVWDDNDNQEYYICGNNMTLVWNYAVDAWYRYEGFDVVKMCSFLGDLYVGTSDGKLLRVTDSVRGDEGKAIKAYWESGALDFGAAYMRKYAAQIWVGLKPQDGTSVDVSVQTDRKNTFREKIISSTKARVKGEPFMVKTKLKAKKFIFYRLLLSVEDKQPPVTVTNVEIRVRQTGYAK